MRTKSIVLLVILIVFGGNILYSQNKQDTLRLENVMSEIISLKQMLSNTKKQTLSDTLIDKSIKVMKVESMTKGRNINTAIYGDYIKVTVNNIEPILSKLDSCRKTGIVDTMCTVVLFINGNSMNDLTPINIDRNQNAFIFQLNRHSPYLMKFNPNFPYLWSSLPVYMSVGFKDSRPIDIDLGAGQFKIKYISSLAITLTGILILFILVSFFLLAKYTNLIRISDDHSSFSLALTQLSFWTIVIASSYLYIWIATEELSVITGSTLIMMSISIGTATAAKLIDQRRNINTEYRSKSQGFFKDILSDDLGYSIHRCQMFLWTVIMVVIFISIVISKQQIPQIDESLLALMGISSGAYVGLKPFEVSKSDEPEIKK